MFFNLRSSNYIIIYLIIFIYKNFKIKFNFLILLFYPKVKNFDFKFIKCLSFNLNLYFSNNFICEFLL